MADTRTRLEQMTDALEHALIGKRIRPLSPNTPVGPWGAPSPIILVPWPNKWKSAVSITVEEVVEIFRHRWESATQAEARQILTILEGTVVRRIGRVWKILHPTRPTPTPDPRLPAPTPLKKGESIYSRRKIKPGVCPRCEANVKNPNRHNNKLHTGEDCRFNIVKKILEE